MTDTVVKLEPDAGVRILLVDDDDGNREVVAYYLRRRGFEVTPVASAQDALAALEGAPPFGLVLLDVVMPDMNGFEVLVRIRHRFSAVELPVVMLTGMDTAEATATGAGLGANDCLAKPYQLADILTCIRRYVPAAPPVERGRAGGADG